MGYMQHHAIVVVSWDEKSLRHAWEIAERLECEPSEIVRSPINGYRSFLVPPDGSKEGWEESEAGDVRRDKLVDELRKLPAQHIWVVWCEVTFGGDSERASVVRHGDDDLSE